MMAQPVLQKDLKRLISQLVNQLKRLINQPVNQLKRLINQPVNQLKDQLESRVNHVTLNEVLRSQVEYIAPLDFFKFDAK